MKSYIELSDEALQKLADSGDREAEEQLSMRYYRLVRMCARPYFLAGGDSEDLTQEGMLGLLSAIREFDSSMNTSFRTYAELCIKRRIYSAVKAASRLKHTPLNDGLSLDDILSDESHNMAKPAQAFQRTPEEQVLARESESEILQIFSQCLSKFEAEILGLYLEGLSYQDMSIVTHKPPKSIDNAVQRIRRKLARTQLSLGDISKN